MGIHTYIYRERDVRPDNYDKYSIRLFKGEEEIKLYNAVSIREAFYFGKSVWAINEWFYQWKLKELKRWGEVPDEDLSYEWINEELVCLDDLKALLKDIDRALANPEQAKKIIPLPNDLELMRIKEECFDKESNTYSASSDDDWEFVPREEMYDKYYYDELKYAKKLLKQIIAEDEGDLISWYILDIG